MDGAVQQVLAALPMPAADGKATETDLERIVHFVDGGDLWEDVDRVARIWRKMPKRCLTRMLKTWPGDATNQAARNMKGPAITTIYKFAAEMRPCDLETTASANCVALCSMPCHLSTRNGKARHWQVWKGLVEGYYTTRERVYGK
jgi:hypothetical protein